MTKKLKPEEIEEVNVGENVTDIVKPEQVLSPEAIESRYQAHLEKIRTGGK